MSIMVILTKAGVNTPRQRVALGEVEAFMAVSKYVIATLTTGEELFVADMIDSANQTKLERGAGGKIRNSLRGLADFMSSGHEERFFLIKKNCLLNMDYLQQVKNLGGKGKGGEATTKGGRTYSTARRCRPALNRAFHAGIGAA